MLTIPGSRAKLTIPTSTAIFILVVSSIVLLHDVSARADDVSMGIAVFPIA